MSRPNLREILGDRPFAHRMGLSTADARRWLVERADPERIAARRAAFTVHPERLSVSHDEAALDDAVRGLRALGIEGEDFAACALGIAADLFVTTRESPRLVAIAVAFPSGFSPEHALGRDVADIHAIVPGLDDALGGRIARFLPALEEGRAYARSNVGLSRGAHLDRHPETGFAPLEATTPLDETFVRIEEQLFVAAGSLVVFAVHLVVLAAHALDDASREALATWLESMPEDVARYKGLEAVRSGLVARLRRR